MPNLSDLEDIGVLSGNPIAIGSQLVQGGNPLSVAGDFLSDPVGFFGSIFGSGTGAAGVHFVNDRNSGTAMHGAKINGKWRDINKILVTYNGGKGLRSFGWKKYKTPRSAQGIFKDAEDKFFEILPIYALAVAQGRAPLLESLKGADDYELIDYINSLGSGLTNNTGARDSEDDPFVLPETGTSTTQCHNLLNEFLRLAFLEFAASYNIVDYTKN